MAVALARLRVIARHLHVPAASSAAGAGGAAAARLHSASTRLSAAARRAAAKVPAPAPAVRAMSTAATGVGAGAGRITDYSRFISELSQRRKPSAIRSLMALVGKPGMISLGGGLPNPDMFPFDSLSFSLKSGEKLQLTPKELAEGLQYSATPGLPALVQWLKELQQRTHKPPYVAASGGAASPDWSVAITVGSQDAICKAFEALLNPGDALLVDSPTYSGTLAFLKPLNCTLIGVETDAYGIVPASLEKCILSAKTKPKVLYTIPTGQNPSGSTFSLERRHAVYALAAKHDLIIMEDDPYYFLYYGDKPAPPKGRDSDFKRPQLQSLMSMDTQGRVLRFDSLSKALSAGMRLGFVTGPTALVDRINLHSQATNLHASTIAQALTLKLLTHWGPAGWDKQIDAVSLFYARKRDAFTALAKKHLTGLAEWTTPTAGMFVWFKLLNGITDSQALISQKALEKKVLLVPGQAFMPNNEKSCYVRASFSTASEADMDVALGRLAEVIREAKA